MQHATVDTSARATGRTTPPPQSKITASMEVVTPQFAADLLREKKENRPISRAHVTELVREILEERWQPTHQGIALNPDGQLIDGQHRLLAVVEADRAVEMMVSYDVPDSAFGVVDQHRRRTGAQLLAIAGRTTDPSRAIPMARTIMTIIGVEGAKKAKYSNWEVADFASQHIEHINPFLAVAKKYSPACGAAFAWCHMLGWGEEVVEAAERLEKAGPWREPQETDPMRALLARSHEFDKLGSGQTRIQSVFDITVNALTANHEGRGLRKIHSTRPKYDQLIANSLAPKPDVDPVPSVHPPKLKAFTPSMFPGQDEHQEVRIVTTGPIYDSEAGDPLPNPDKELTDEQAAELDRRYGPRSRKTE